MGKTKPAQKGPTPFISSSLSHSSLWPDPWAIPVNRLEVCRWGKRNPMPPFSTGGFKPGEVMKCCLKIKFRGFTTILDWTLNCETRLFATLYNQKSCVLPEEDKKSFHSGTGDIPTLPNQVPLRMWEINKIAFWLQHQLSLLDQNVSGNFQNIKFILYCHPAYLTYMQSTSWETLDWKKHKLESRLPGEISITSDMQMTEPLWQKVKRS